MPWWDEGPLHWDFFTAVTGNDPVLKTAVSRAPEAIVAINTGM